MRVRRYIRAAGMIAGVIVLGAIGSAVNEHLVTPAWAQLAGVWDFSGATVQMPVAANGAVATALSSVGPTGSHTTVQEWIKLQGSGGATRWVPAF